MAGGLLALFDDIAVLAKYAAANLDDIAAGAAKSASKTVPVLIDDAAVTPQFVSSVEPKRELPIIWKITLGSFRNKFLFVVPLALILTWLAPWALPYLLIIGGLYLSFEGAHKILEWLKIIPHHAEESSTDEKSIVNSATRTDLVLSAEIMLISLASIEVDNWIMRAGMLSIIAVAMTILVYGTVALLVKLDDVGLYFAQNAKTSLGRKFGMGTAKSMPVVFKILSVVGTAAMLWVGGHLIWKSLGDAGWDWATKALYVFHEIPNSGLAWISETVSSAIIGLLIGALAFMLSKLFVKTFKK